MPDVLAYEGEYVRGHSLTVLDVMYNELAMVDILEGPNRPPGREKLKIGMFCE